MPEKETPSRRDDTKKQAPSRRNDVIRCENCGEDYSVTYKCCPFCDERPGRTGVNGRRVNGAGEGRSVHPVQVIGLVISLVLIIAALFIVFKYVGPMLFGGKSEPGVDVSGSQSGAWSESVQPSGSASGDLSVDGDASTGEELPVVQVDSITLNRSDFTLMADEEYTITAQVAPADAGATVVWTSSDPNALTVNEYGVVKNVNTGTEKVKVTVTATAGDKSAECTVYCRPGSTGTSANNTATGTATTTPATTEPTTGSNASTGTSVVNRTGTIINAGSGLNVRSGPGSSYEVVASAANGAVVTVLEDTGTGWYKINYGGNNVGYVASSYVSLS
jgi:hypothetical protein